MREVLIDTDIFSEILERRDPHVAARAKQYFRIYRTFTISAVTLFETFRGLEYKPKPGVTRAFEEFKPGLRILPVEEDEGMVGGVIHGQLKRKGVNIGNIDPMIGATALNYGLVLATANIDDYQHIVDLGYPLELENWRYA